MMKIQDIKTGMRLLDTRTGTVGEADQLLQDSYEPHGWHVKLKIDESIGHYQWASIENVEVPR